MIVTNKITMDLIARGNTPRIDAVQFDENSRAIEISVNLGGVAWVPPEEIEIAVSYQKSDGTTGLYDKLPNGNAACTIENNSITAIMAPQMLTVPGLVKAVVIMYEEGSQLATFPFYLNVEPNPSASGGVSNDYYNYQTFGALNSAIGDLSKLPTSDKSSLVSAVIEIFNTGGGLIGNVYTKNEIDAMFGRYVEDVDELIGG